MLCIRNINEYFIVLPGKAFTRTHKPAITERRSCWKARLLTFDRKHMKTTAITRTLASIGWKQNTLTLISDHQGASLTSGKKYIARLYKLNTANYFNYVQSRVFIY